MADKLPDIFSEVKPKQQVVSGSNFALPDIFGNGKPLPVASDWDSIRGGLIEQESGGDYEIMGDVVKNGARALGKYQIMSYNLPKYAGLEDTPENWQLFLKDHDLQDKAFGKLTDELFTQYKDPQKAVAAYYGGDYGAKVVGTPEGDKPQYAYKNGKKVEYPSVNSYVQSVLGKAKLLKSRKGANNLLPKKDEGIEKPEQIQKFMPDKDMDVELWRENPAAKQSLYNTKRIESETWGKGLEKVEGYKKELEGKAKQINDSALAENKALEQEIELFKKDVAEKIDIDFKKLDADYKKKISEAETVTEQRSLKKEYESKFNELQLKYKKQQEDYYKKAEEKGTKIAEKNKSDIEKLNADSKNFNIDEDGFFKGKENEIASLVDKAPASYQDRKAYIDRLAKQYTANAVDKKSAEDEFYHIVNEKLLFDKDGNPTSFLFKNQAELKISQLQREKTDLTAKLKPYIDKMQKALVQGVNIPLNALTKNPQVLSDFTKLSNIDLALNGYIKAMELPDDGGTFAKGLKESEPIAITFSVGVIDAMKSMNLVELAKKSYYQEQLTPEEQEVLNAASTLAGAASTVVPMSTLYQIGTTMGKMPSFILQMIGTGGVAKAANIATKKALGFSLAKAASKSIAGRAASGGITMAGEAVGALSRVPFSPMFYQTVAERQTNIKPEVTSGGIQGKGEAPKESMFTSLGKSYLLTGAEYFSEGVGKYLDVGFNSVAKKAIPKLFKYMGLGVLNKMPKNIIGKVVAKTKKVANIDSALSEILEEYINTGIQVGLGEAKLSDFANRQNFFVIAGSVVPLSFLGGGMAAITGSRAAEGIDDYISPDQKAELNNALQEPDLEAKAKAVTEFTFKHKIDDPAALKEIAKYSFVENAPDVADIAKAPETKEGEPVYSIRGRAMTKEKFIDVIKNATPDDLETGRYVYPQDDAEVKQAIDEYVLGKEEAEQPEMETEAVPEEKAETPVAESIIPDFVSLKQQIAQTKGAAKKAALETEKQALLDSSPRLRYIDENIANINSQLEQKGLLTRKGDC